jgi:hypothetical protein
MIVNILILGEVVKAGKQISRNFAQISLKEPERSGFFAV